MPYPKLGEKASPRLTTGPLKVMLLCSGVGIMNRGIESFFLDCFNGLHPLAAGQGLHLQLLKGAGPEAPDLSRIWCLKRTGYAAKLASKFARRNPYVVEQLSSILPIIRRIRRDRPDVIFSSEVNVLTRLQKYRDRIGVPYRILFSNGGPVDPPFHGADHVQQVAPFYVDAAVQKGVPADQQSLVPYGIVVPDGDPDRSPDAKAAVRSRLGLPVDRPIILSVGWISAEHKRMDYVVREVAQVLNRQGGPKPYLVMLGAMDANTPPIIRLAGELLGAENFTACSVPYEQVGQYYQAADIFILGSTKEGFGRVYLEALMAGLPCVVHDQEVMRYVLEVEGTFADLNQEGAAATSLERHLHGPDLPEAWARRRSSVRARFSWPVLAPAYAEMFRRASGGNNE